MVRYVTPGDAGTIAAIYNHYVATSTAIFSQTELSPDDMLQKIVDTLSAGFPFLVWEDNGAVRGYCYAHSWQHDKVYEHTWEVTIYVEHGYTGHGAGTHLLRQLVNESRNRGAHTLVSCVTGGNDASCRLHERMGFLQVSLFREVGYKFGQWLDDVHYQLIL